MAYLTASASGRWSTRLQQTGKNVETNFGKVYYQLFIRWSWVWLVALLSVATYLGSFLTEVKVDASADSLVLEGDEDLAFYRKVVKRYGSQEFLVIALEPKSDLFSDESFLAIRKLATELGALNGVDSVITMLDVPLLYSPKVSISDLSGGLHTIVDKSVERELAKQEFQTSPIYKELLTSLDGKVTALQVNLTVDLEGRKLLENRELLRQQVSSADSSIEGLQVALDQAEKDYKAHKAVAAIERTDLIKNVRDIFDDYRSEVKQIYLGGVPMIADDMVTFVKGDLSTFGLGILLFVIVLLIIIFRSPRWVLLALASCLLVNVVMLGLLGLLDWRLTVISSNFVAMLLIMTLAVTVHLIVKFRELERTLDQISYGEMAAKTAEQMLRPCIYATLTTGIAFASLVISGIRPIIDFGWMMTLGVTVALLISFILIPIGAAIGRKNKLHIAKQAAIAEKPPFTLFAAKFAEGHRTVVLLAAIGIAIFAVTGMARLKVENRFIDYFSKETEIYQGMELIDQSLGGTIPLEILLFSSNVATASTDLEEDGFFDDDFEDEFEEGNNSYNSAFEDDFDDDFSEEEWGDEFDGEGETNSNEVPPWFSRHGLEKVKSVHDYLDGLEETGKVLSLATVYQVARDLLSGTVDDIQLSFAYRGLPDDIRATMIDPYLSADANEARILVRVKETSRTLNRNELLQQVDRHMQESLGFEPDSYRLSGMLVLYNNMLQSLFTSQILTLGAVFVAITIMLVVLFNSLSLALIGIAPNVLAAFLVLGGMGWAGLPLDLMTITIAAISIGIGVDDTIHYIHRFKTEFVKDQNYVQAMYRSHGSIGRAMFYTSVTVISGFSILALSNFNPSIYFGLLTGVAMLAALAGALLLLPCMLNFFKPLGRFE